MKFIQDKINATTIVRSPGQDSRDYSYVLRMDAPQGCALKFTSMETWLSKGSPVSKQTSIREWSISLQSVESITVGPQTGYAAVGDAYRLELHSSENAFSLHWVRHDDAKNILQNGVNVTDKVEDDKRPTAWIYFNEEDLANRVAKAFTHAIELCGGGNKDPF